MLDRSSLGNEDLSIPRLVLYGIITTVLVLGSMALGGPIGLGLLFLMFIGYLVFTVYFGLANRFIKK